MQSRHYYLLQDGSLERKNNTLFFRSDCVDIYIPIVTVDVIHAFGQIKFNKSLFEFLSIHNVTLNLYSRGGRFICSYHSPSSSSNAEVLLNQVRSFEHTEKRATIIGYILSSAFNQMKEVISYYRKRKLITCSAEDLNVFKSSVYSLSEIQKPDPAFALEGKVRNHYYKFFDEILYNSPFVFEKRSRRPPENEFNAILSFLNVVFYNLITTEIRQTKLDNRIGFLHSPMNSRAATLNLDIAELFKPIIVDRTIFSMINRRQLKLDHFSKKKNGEFVLSAEGKKVALQCLEQKLETRVAVKGNRPMSYRRLIRSEIYALQAFIVRDKPLEVFKIGR